MISPSNITLLRFIGYMVCILAAFKFYGLPLGIILLVSFLLIETVSRGLQVVYEQVSTLKQMIFLQQVSRFYSSNMELVVDRVSKRDLEAYEQAKDDENVVNRFLAMAQVGDENLSELPLELKKQIAEELYGMCKEEQIAEDTNSLETKE